LELIVIRIGIVGAENSHTVAIARTLNVQKKVPGCRVVSVWGETRAYAKNAAEKGEIEAIVRNPADMIGSVDAAILDHRHPKHHLSAAKDLLEAKIPLFIDKPFCYRTREGKAFLARAKQLRVPVTSFSVLPKQQSFADLKKKVRKLGKIRSVISSGPADIKSKYGGIFFYGIHQIDMVVRLLGNDVTHVQLNRGKGGHTATLYSASGAISTMNLFGEFHVSVIGEKGRVDQTITFDEAVYLRGIKDFCRMFKTGKTDETYASIMTPVAVLEALEKSVEQRRKIKVPTI